ncbi:mandelate racemase/muconate lactonizing enzyme family protein [Anaerolentibacter hominis]|uniref:mandelate racemase/muconate lactonizing enzyme family protein n=1 Tax=Anaerolentibacter hominis TaxID=3079009 RepID=UPI0031B87048
MSHSNTEIKDIRIFQAVSQLSRPIADATHEISKIAFYVLEVETNGGVTGQGYLLSFHYSPNGIEGALKDLRNFVMAREYQIYETAKVQSDYEIESEYFGIPGLQRWALAALNVAMWDAWARTLDQPVYRLFGCNVKPIPVYGSGGWISYTDEELVDEVVEYKKRGFTAVKIKVGSPDMERDVRRLNLVREALGPDVKIMMDANQGMDVPSAVKLISRVEELGIFWFEEPVSNTDFEGYGTIHSKTKVSLAMGEREYSAAALRELIRRGALDLWQPDLIRLGGVEAWRESAALAAAYHIPVLPHYYKDYDVPLLCTVSNPYGAESFDWIDGIIDEPMVIKNGFALPRTGSGWGFRFLPEHRTEIK